MTVLMLKEKEYKNKRTREITLKERKERERSGNWVGGKLIKKKTKIKRRWESLIVSGISVYRDL